MISACYNKLLHLTSQHDLKHLIFGSTYIGIDMISIYVFCSAILENTQFVFNYNVLWRLRERQLQREGLIMSQITISQFNIMDINIKIFIIFYVPLGQLSL